MEDSLETPEMKRPRLSQLEEPVTHDNGTLRDEDTSRSSSDGHLGVDEEAVDSPLLPQTTSTAVEIVGTKNRPSSPCTQLNDSDSGLEDSGSQQESYAAESSSEFYQSVSWNDVESSNDVSASSDKSSEVSSRNDDEADGPCYFYPPLSTQEDPSIDDVPLGSEEVTIETTPTTRQASRRRRVLFESVNVFYFDRAQGFTCVPSQGGSTLGMARGHWAMDEFSVSSYQRSRRRERRAILHQHCLEGSLTLPRDQREALERNVMRRSEAEVDGDLEDSEEDEDEEEEATLSCVEDYYFLQPVPIKRRRMILREAGIQRIDHNERLECQDIRLSREMCGCECPGGVCLPEHCSCAQAGIQCQVDRANFPCACVRPLCHNQTGRVEFNPVRVKTHYIHTLMRLEMEKHGYDPSGDVDAASDPASSFNSTERGSCRDCQNQAYMQAVVHELRQSGLLSSPSNISFCQTQQHQQQSRITYQQQPSVLPSIPGSVLTSQVAQPLQQHPTAEPAVSMSTNSYTSEDEDYDEDEDNYEDFEEESGPRMSSASSSSPSGASNMPSDQQNSSYHSTAAYNHHHHQQLLDPITTLLPLDHSSRHHHHHTAHPHLLQHSASYPLHHHHHHHHHQQSTSKSYPPSNCQTEDQPSNYATLQPVNRSPFSPAAYGHLVPVPPVSMPSPLATPTAVGTSSTSVCGELLEATSSVFAESESQEQPSSLGEALKTSLIETVTAL